MYLYLNLFLILIIFLFFFFFFNDTATTEIYTLSLHDALPISSTSCSAIPTCHASGARWTSGSEEHTSELQSRVDLVCRLLLEKKKNNKNKYTNKKNKKKQKQQKNKK